MNRNMLFGWASHDLTTLVEEERLFGHNNGMLSTYVDFVQSPNFPVDYAQAAADRNAALLIAWEPWDWYAPIGEQPFYAPRRIAAGELDTWITNWLEEAQSYTPQIRLIVRFAPEMNDSSRPWGNSVETKGYDPTTPEDYIAMWRHVYEIKQRVAPGVEFMWNPLNFGAGAHPFETYFPGIDYVDSVGLNGFNWSNKQDPTGSWQSNDDVFGFGDDPETPINRLIELAEDKPWGLAETASAPVDPADFQPGGQYFDAWGSWVFEWPENPPYEATPDDWITQEGWTEMLIRRSWDKGAAFVNLFHTIKETDWRLTDTPRGRAVPSRAVQAGVNLVFGSTVTDPGYENPGPSIPKPDHTSDVYDDVYSKGSSFGQELEESSVRGLLMGRGRAPFDGAHTALGGMLNFVVGGIADAISGIGSIGSLFRPIGDAVKPIRDGQLDITKRTDLLEDVQGYAHAYMTKNINAQWNLGNNWRFLPFDGQLGPAKGARVRSDGRVEMGSKGLWLILAKIHGRETSYTGGAAVTLRVRVFAPNGDQYSDSYTRGTTMTGVTAFASDKDNGSVVTSFPVVVPGPGYYVRVDAWSSAWRWWDGGTRLSSLSVIKQSNETTNRGQETVPDEKESDPHE